ncbi:hypothetical protein [Yersinia aleksiciae]|uniref:Uncharacterized protein n=1 Tax=Yersinia aleksiciae TaxID=263819 RepID=A0ABN4H111_YERAE|nr:hypothetical protein [Yersinia aleksiciae]AKP32140.1 hypothetical protein ACZ76_00505 [Yersinia aleksiciae]CFQ34307.1 Uncharacterised protein [Yersinia aleksiciae]
MPGQLIELTSGALVVLVALIWVAFLSVRAMFQDYHRRSSNKKEAERRAFLERKAEVERKARQQL